MYKNYNMPQLHYQ